MLVERHLSRNYARKDMDGVGKADTAVANSLNKEFGQNLNDLNDKAQDLRDSAEYTRQKQHKTWYQNMKIKLVVLNIILLILIIVLSISTVNSRGFHLDLWSDPVSIVELS